MAMRRMSVFALVAAVAVAATCAEAWANHGASSFTVTGTVLCQDCTQNWNSWAYGAKPIAGSLVGITCLDSSNSRTVYHGTDTTDKEGAFNIEVPYSINGASLDPTMCVVRLASSGDPACAVLTDFNGGKTGERPYRPSHVYPGNLKYMVGPFYCTVPQCDLKQYN